MSAIIIPFPKKGRALQALDASTVVATEVTIDRLSDAFLKLATDMHSAGEDGANIYRGLMLSLCSLVIRSDDDPSVVEKRFEACLYHMREAHRILASKLRPQ